jgi:hypothetical protein
MFELLTRLMGSTAFLIKSIIKFAKSITASIAGFTTSVALHEVLHKFVYTFLFFGGIVSISLLPSSIKMMANGYAMDKMASKATS